MPLSKEDQKSLRLLLVVVAGFLCGLSYLVFILLTGM